MAEAQGFKQKLDAKSLEVFNAAASKSFSEQAVFFLNAFWDEYGDQAEWIYSVAWDQMKKTDMQVKGVNYVHLYEEGADLDFDMGLRFFEVMNRFQNGDSKHKEHIAWIAEHKDFKEEFAKSQVGMMTSVKRKKELRDQVDVNFDGRVGMLEYLLYQYGCEPKDLIARSMNTDENEEIRKARLALEEVNRRIAAYEAEKLRLETAAKLPGVKGLRAKNELAQLLCGPLWEALNKALITAEAAVRIATKNAGKRPSGGDGQPRTDGAIWWMNTDLAEKKKKYGKK